MRKFHVTVNGNTYEVEIEEVTGNTAAPVAAPAPSAPKAAPAAQPKAAAVTGGTPVRSPLSATVLKLNCTVGQAVKKGDVVCVLEAMKMENDISAPADGTVAEIRVAVGDSVAAEDVLLVLK